MHAFVPIQLGSKNEVLFSLSALFSRHEAGSDWQRSEESSFELILKRGAIFSFYSSVWQVSQCGKRPESAGLSLTSCLQTCTRFCHSFSLSAFLSFCSRSGGRRPSLYLLGDTAIRGAWTFVFRVKNGRVCFLQSGLDHLNSSATSSVSVHQRNSFYVVEAYARKKCSPFHLTRAGRPLFRPAHTPTRLPPFVTGQKSQQLIVA